LSLAAIAPIRCEAPVIVIEVRASAEGESIDDLRFRWRSLPFSNRPRNEDREPLGDWKAFPCGDKGIAILL